MAQDTNRKYYSATHACKVAEQLAKDLGQPHDVWRDTGALNEFYVVPSGVPVHEHLDSVGLLRPVASYDPDGTCHW